MKLNITDIVAREVFSVKNERFFLKYRKRYYLRFILIIFLSFIIDWKIENIFLSFILVISVEQYILDLYDERLMPPAYMFLSSKILNGDTATIKKYFLIINGLFVLFVIIFVFIFM